MSASVGGGAFAALAGLQEPAARKKKGGRSKQPQPQSGLTVGEPVRG